MNDYERLKKRCDDLENRINQLETAIVTNSVTLFGVVVTDFIVQILKKLKRD